KYQEFCNAYAYYKQAVLCNSKPNRQKLMQECITAWKEVREQNTSFIENKINEYYNTIPPTIHSHQNFFLSHPIKNISECQQMVEITTDESLKVTLKTKIIEEEHTLSEQR
ncbi:17429_t:CDS:2, partial [Rhizophagus irregularis]